MISGRVVMLIACLPVINLLWGVAITFNDVNCTIPSADMTIEECNKTVNDNQWFVIGITIALNVGVMIAFIKGKSIFEQPKVGKQ